MQLGALRGPHAVAVISSAPRRSVSRIASRRKVAWRHRYPGTGGNLGNGMLTTAGKLLFAGDLGGNLVAYDPANGKILWHTHLGQVSNAPETYMLDGHQYILIAVGDSLYSFELN